MRDYKLAPRPSQPDRPLYGLVSLNDVHEINAVHLLKAKESIDQTVDLLKQYEGDDEINSVVSDHVLEKANEHMLALRHACGAIGARVARHHTDEIIHKSTRGTLTWKEFGDLCEKIRESLYIEAQQTKFLVIEAHKEPYYDEFGLSLEDRIERVFPGVRREIDEAGRCYALDRNTAATLHAMRALEVPLHAVAEELGISSQEASWHKVLKMIDTELSKDYRQSKLKNKLSFYSEVATCLRPIIKPRRNPAAHLSPFATDERARKIIEDTIYLLRVLADHFVEDASDSPNVHDLSSP
jgi:hypothetical protein